ncbi:hypothetical protein BH10PLA2_BH10PLA2_11280 [soil metagenome]
MPTAHSAQTPTPPIKSSSTPPKPVLAPSDKDFLRAALKSLREVSPRLNSITDKTTEIVATVENFLNEVCKIGMAGSVQLSADEELFEGTSLEYRRFKGRFRIVVVHYTAEDQSVKTWTECTRSDRLVAFKKLPQLLQAVAKAAEDEIKIATKTAETVTELLAAFTPPPRGDEEIPF